MDFQDSPQEAAFRAEARAWLEANAEPLPPGGTSRFDGLPEQEGLAASKEWQQKKYDDGWACITWPKEHGGRGATFMEGVIWAQEEAKFDVPDGFLGIGHGTCAPAIMAHGTEEQKRRYLPKLASGEEIWCQLFSEPGAGSDLAGLRTRAERDGDEWVVNGQKVWNSGAHYADWGILVTRHDPTVPKHKGLTFFVVDMKSQGIEPRPIRQIPGTSEFNEVFLQNVRVPDHNRLGEVGAGWQVAITTLMNERHGRYQMTPDWSDALRLASELEIDGEPAANQSSVRERIADWYVQCRGVELTFMRTLTAISQGKQPGPENSICKVITASARQDIASFAADLLDSAGAVSGRADAPSAGMFHYAYLASPGMRIAAGTDEILRNIIAERVLTLPGEIRVDRDRAFSDIPTGSN